MRWWLVLIIPLTGCAEVEDPAWRVHASYTAEGYEEGDVGPILAKYDHGETLHMESYPPVLVVQGLRQADCHALAADLQATGWFSGTRCLEPL